LVCHCAPLLASIPDLYKLCVPGAHGVREEPQFVTARAGESVILGCDVPHPLNGKPYVVEWFKYGMQIPFFINFRFYPPHVDPEYAGRATLHGKSSLQIDGVRSDDQGWYECKVLLLEHQLDTFHNGSWVHLTVNAPPTFKDTPPQYVEAKEGGSITLTCTAFGNPKPSISWLREGSLLISSAKYKVSDGNLTVLSITREDRGPYTCRAFSLQGEAVHTTRLLVQGPPFITSPPVNITVNISQDAFFSCRAEAYPGNLTFTWLWEKDNVFFKNQMDDGSIRIAEVTEDSLGTYTCMPYNDLGSMGWSPPAPLVLKVTTFKCPPHPTPRLVLTRFGCLTMARTLQNSLWFLEGSTGRRLVGNWSSPVRQRETPFQISHGGRYRLASYNAISSLHINHFYTISLISALLVVTLQKPLDDTVLLLVPIVHSVSFSPRGRGQPQVGKPSKSKHNVLPRGNLQLKSLTKDDHGEWECVATNVATSITASTHVQVIGTSPHAPTSIRVAASSTWANVSWEASYDGGFQQTFSVWLKRERLGPHDWVSIPVPGGQDWMVLSGLEPDTTYQFSVLAQNKLGTGPFSEVVTVNTLVFPTSTPEPLVLLTPPRCLTANRTQQGVLLTWIPPANHTAPIQHYVMEFRLGERWETLDDSIPAGELELLARDLIQEAWYEFRIMAVMDDTVSEPSNVVGVSSTDFFPPPESEERGLTRPVVAGIVATICFLAAAVLFSTMAACFVNKQRRKKLKRRKDPPLSITHCRKSMETPSSSGKVSPESTRSKASPSESSEDSHDQRGMKPPPRPGKREDLSLYMKTKRAITSKRYMSKHEAEPTTPIELISRGPDGRFVIDPTDAEMSVKPRRIEGFPFVEESDLYPEFRQSDEENDDPRPLPPVMAPLRPHQISPISSQESYLQPPAYSPRFHRPFEGMTIMESSQLQATGQIRGSLHHRAFYGYLGPPGDHDPPPPFYLPDTSPLRSVMSSPPYFPEGPFVHPMIPEDVVESDFPQYAVSSFPLPLTLTTSSHSPDIWQGLDFTFSSLEGPQFIFPPHHPLHPRHDPPYASPPHVLPLSAFQHSTLPMPTYPAVLPLEAPKGHTSKSPSKTRPHGSPARHLAMQEAHLGQLRPSGRSMGVPVLSYSDPLAHIVPSSFSNLDTRWFETTPRFSPRQTRRMDSGLHQVVLQPSRLSPLTQSPLSSQEGSPEIVVRPRPRPSVVQPPAPTGMSEMTLLPPSTASFSRRSSPNSSPAQGQGSRRASSCYHSHMAFATSATSYSASQSPSSPMECSGIFGQMPAHRRTEEELLPSEPSPSRLSASG
uniref:Immunoglobulin superfamily, member 9Bb n=1 Tax=Cyprinodon variegatus TaxID=28743 RepID=A0A3Q2CVH6_CYPVA